MCRLSTASTLAVDLKRDSRNVLVSCGPTTCEIKDGISRTRKKMRKVVRLFPVFRIRADVDLRVHKQRPYIGTFEVCEPLRHHLLPFLQSFYFVFSFRLYDEWNAAKSTNVPRNFTMDHSQMRSDSSQHFVPNIYALPLVDS